MTLVDTSAWIHSLRPDGDPAIAGRVRALLEAGEAAWCPLVQLELWNGARGERERLVVTEMAAGLPSLPIDERVWAAAYLLARKARTHGVTVPATDVLISSCARQHGAALEHDDGHFGLLVDL